MFIINAFKKCLTYFRTTIKYTFLVIISIFLIITAVAVFYKPTYAVSVNGELVGYTENKSQLQARINDYMEGNTEEDVAFAQIDSVPEYTLCLLKKDITANDEEIYNKVTENGTKYYKYYAITDDKKEKVYVETFEEAEKVIAELKKKKSKNQKEVGIVEKYDTELKKFTSVEKCVSKLYEAPPKKTTTTTYMASNTNYTQSVSGGNVTGSSSSKVNLGVALIRPISGIITTRFGSRGYGHRGLDVAAPSGTPIKAAAGGTVTTAGWNNSYGYMLIVSHGNGVQTVYAHCSQLIAKSGQSVAQGQVIGKVGSTGYSTGPHLHFEIRVNGVLQDPQNYIY
ncbi:MAG: M23 family metallopeptidase [Clostridia bacterium]|nr:M23 family metallopeptidase [Clostridia bacterium]MCI9413206.1 M23 family metallopeptidase [Clostridia bacterium]